jgi:hypothetical protein
VGLVRWFGVLIPDNMSPIIADADPVNPTFTLGWLDYAQARGFHTDPARVRHAKDKGLSSDCTSCGGCGGLCCSGAPGRAADLLERRGGGDLVVAFALVVDGLPDQAAFVEPGLDRDSADGAVMVQGSLAHDDRQIRYEDPEQQECYRHQEQPVPPTRAGAPAMLQSHGFDPLILGVLKLQLIPLPPLLGRKIEPPLGNMGCVTRRNSASQTCLLRLQRGIVPLNGPAR